MLEKRRRVQVECPTAVESLSAHLLQWLAERQKTTGLVTVAVAFDCLVTEDFVPEIFDIPLDWILTESGMRPAEKKTGRNTMDAARLMQH